MADNLLDTAIANWGPRFTANGVDASDYQRLTSSILAWDDWCSAWSARADDYVELAHAALAAGHRTSAGEFFARAATYYHFAKFLFFVDRDEARAAHASSVAALTQALPRLNPPGRRVEIAFDGAQLVGVLRVPRGEGPHPTVILIPGLDSTKEEFRDVERAFLDRNMATFAMDGPGQGEAEEALAIRPEWDLVGRAVFDALARNDDVDAERIAVWGVSLGGLYAARLAASDLPVRATVALCPPYDMGDVWPKLNPLTREAFTVRSKSSSPDAAQRRAADVTLAGFAERIRTPLLVIAGRLDRLFPWQDAARLADEAQGASELLVIDDGNHGCANVIPQHRPYGADWIAGLLHVQGEPG